MSTTCGEICNPQRINTSFLNTPNGIDCIGLQTFTVDYSDISLMRICDSCPLLESLDWADTGKVMNRHGFATLITIIRPYLPSENLRHFGEIGNSVADSTTPAWLSEDYIVKDWLSFNYKLESLKLHVNTLGSMLTKLELLEVVQTLVPQSI